MRSSFFRRPQFIVVMMAVVLFVVCDFMFGYVLLDGVPYASNMYYHHGLKPNLSSEARWGSAHYRVTTNSLGFRDDNPREVPPVGTNRRILFLGDSFTDGVGIPFGQTFVGIIRDRIRRTGDNTEVLNGGVASHSPRLYLLHLQDLMERQGIKFDEIVVLIDVSDIQDELVYEDFAPGRLTLSLAMRHLKQFVEQNSLVANVLFNRLPALRPHMDALRSWLRGQSGQEANPKPASVTTAAEAVTSAQQPPADFTRPAREVWDNPNYYANRDLWIDSDEAFHAWGGYGLNLARANLTRLADYAASKGMEISFVIYPWPRFARHPDNRGRLVWTKIASEQKWMLVDLYPDFAAVPDVERLYIHGDVHWNAEGHRFVAERWLAHFCDVRHATWCEQLYAGNRQKAGTESGSAAR